MAEEVSTGGMMKFRYDGGNKSRLSDEKKEEIREAYQRYHERKLREKKKRLMFWIIGLLLFLTIVGVLFFL